MTGPERVTLGGCEIHVLPVVKGLKSEVGRVRDAFERVSPDKVAVSASREDVEGLRNMPADFEPELSRYDEIYAALLARFGEVAAPPPCYVATVELADHLGIPLVAVDLDEDSFSELYCAVVSGSALFRHSTRTWLLRRRRFEASSAEEFVLKWDRAVNNMQGMRFVEQKRAETIASGLAAAAAGSRCLLAVVDLERAADVLGRLKARSH